MKLSVITINFNNRNGLEKTILSIINQTYNSIEYIVIDGGSTDGSVEIIKQYAPEIDYWISERDAGIYNAMNKGIVKATGDYLLFMNSGDSLVDCFVLEKFTSFEFSEDIVYGNVYFTGGSEKSAWCPPAKLTFNHFVENSIPHQASFIKRKLFNTVGLYDEQLKISSDWKFFLDAIIKFKCTYKKVELYIADFDVNGLSNNSALVESEKFSVITKQYAALLFEAYRANFKIASNVKRSRLVSLLKKIGFFRNIDLN